VEKLKKKKPNHVQLYFVSFHQQWQNEKELTEKQEMGEMFPLKSNLTQSS